MTGLKSDRDRRDNFVQRRVLETEQHPSITFVPRSVRGVFPLPRVPVVLSVDETIKLELDFFLVPARYEVARAPVTRVDEIGGQE